MKQLLLTITALMIILPVSLKAQESDLVEQLAKQADAIISKRSSQPKLLQQLSTLQGKKDI